MALETVSDIYDLVATNPTSGDPKAQGDDHIRNIKTALLASFANSVASNGYQYVGGIIIQWGTSASIAGGGSTTGTVTFPLAFPTACLSVLITPSSEPGGSSTPSWVTTKSASSFGIRNQHSNASTFMWIAIGH